MQWLKNLFREKKTIEEVKQWAAEEAKKQDERQQKAVAGAEQTFPELIKTARQSVASLEKAELRNPNIPERAKHFMQGNREHFLKLTIRFTDNLIVPKTGPDFSQLDLLFQQYAQNAARPGAILSEFFGEEVKNVRKSLAEAEALLKDLKELHLQKEQMLGILDLIQRMDDVKRERASIEQQKTNFEQQLQQLKNKHEALKKEKEAFTSKPEYQKIKEELVAAARERQEAEQAIASIFLPLSDALKKYAHQFKIEKLAAYGENPLEALMHDYSFGILKYVPAIKDALASGSLELKPEKMQKAQEAIRQLNKDSLGKMIHRYANAKKRETDIHHDLAQRSIMQEYEQYAQALRQASTDIQQLETTISKLTLPTDDELKEMLKAELEKFKIVLI